MTRTQLLSAAAGAIIVVVLVAVSISRGKSQDDQRSRPVAHESPVATSSPTLAPRAMGSGSSTVSTSTELAHATNGAVSATPNDPIGTVQPVRADANAQVASVAAAIRDKNHPERLSTLVMPPPFDLAQFRKDPQAYIDVVQPSRAFQTAPPGPATPVLRPLTPTQVTMRQDGQIILRVLTLPNMPATFTSFDLGRFSNQLTSQTVLADANGVASVSFGAGPGTIDAVHIQAASPVASGEVLFDVQVQSRSTTSAGQRAGSGI